MSKKEKRTLIRIMCALVIFFVVLAVTELLPLGTMLGSERTALYLEFVLFLIPYLIAGYDVLLKSAQNISRGQIFDENFLMSIASLGAFAMIAFPESSPHMAEGAAVMLFYQVGELFQDYAVGKSRASIAHMMDIAPDYANITENNTLVQVDPASVAIGTEIVIKPGERVPLDGIVVNGASQIDTAALTGEAVPRTIEEGTEILSGCVNLTGKLVVKTTKAFGESTVSRILELVENASEKKARTENFVTRFARVYTPIVCAAALIIAIIPPLLGVGAWSDWILRGLTFLVVSCPCALVISVPLSFFGGIGAASKLGILVKGSNYLEVLAKTNTIVFDKTGTLTNGCFEVVDMHTENGTERAYLLETAAYLEAFSDHPIALSIKKAYKKNVEGALVSDIEEISGCGISARIASDIGYIGNEKLMERAGIICTQPEIAGTILHVARNGLYLGYIIIADVLKEDAESAICALHKQGITHTVMLTGDREEVARVVAKKLGIDEVHAELLPQDKVGEVERLLAKTSASGTHLAFVGDGINDAPVLMRADVGIAMGAMGSDAAIEAADVVLMDDKPANIARAISIAKKTMRIVWENIIFALGVKFGVLILAALGLANMWLAVFADVGVAMLAILNAMRALHVAKVTKRA